MTTIGHTRDIFLFCMSVIYLIAFTSLYVQIPGLYGDKGILPAKLVLEKERSSSWDELMSGKPTLLKLTPQLGLTVQEGMDLLAFVGACVAFLGVVFKPMRDCVSFILLWMLYLSLYQVGQTFLWFQWDILLLEVGFLTILVAPLNIQIPLKRFRMAHFHKHDTITMWLVRWLLFRLMFSSGVVKLTSKCPTWWGLTALTWHFESQCIPTPLAWYWHHVPEWFLKLSCVATYVIEIPIPFMFFAPVRSMRVFAFWSQVLLQILIILTGNYNFFNILTIALCLSLLDDTSLGYSNKNDGSTWTNRLASLVAYGYIGYHTYVLFNLKLTDTYAIESKVGFTEQQFDKFLSVTMPWTIYYAAFSLAFEILAALIRSYTEIKGMFWKNWAAGQCLVYGAIAVAMFSISLVPYVTIHKDAKQVVPKQAFQLHSKVSDFHLTSSYGLFRRMTGVGGRPEVVIEGSNSRDGEWKEYEFYYKPGKLDRRPPIVAPHQPRLDWQMWFAALGSYQHNPWFINLAYRLLTNEPDVLALVQHNPFPDRPPMYLRAQLYKYHYTKDTGAKRWWTRKVTGEYMSIITKDDTSLVQYLTHSHILDPEGGKGKKKKQKTAGSGFFAQAVQWLRKSIGQPEGFVFTMSVILAALTINFMTSIIMS